MATTITVAIEKGGCGKTVTVTNLADLMSDDGNKVLAVDTDPQGNLTYALTGARITDRTYIGKGLYDMYNNFGVRPVTDFISETNLEGVDIIAANSSTPRIANRLHDLLADSQLLEDGDPNKLSDESDFLRYFLEQVQDKYDYILIDTQPSRDNIMVMSALMASDYVLVPMVCDSFAMDSAFRTYQVCTKLKTGGVSKIRGIGVMLTMVEKASASEKIRENCKSVLGATLYDTEIRYGKSVKNSVIAGIPVVEYARTQPPAQSYIAAYAELKRRLDVIREE